jgi:hypothetical protein
VCSLQKRYHKMPIVHTQRAHPSATRRRKNEQTVDSLARTVNIRVANAVGTANVIVDEELNEAFVAKVVRADTCPLTHPAAVGGVHARKQSCELRIHMQRVDAGSVCNYVIEITNH